MKKIILNGQFSRFLMILTAFVLIIRFESSAQILLNNQSIPIEPNGFYIAEVDDLKVEPNAKGNLSLKGGAGAAIRNYIKQNLPLNKELRPVIISIKALEITEAQLPNGSTEGHIKLYLSFGLKKDYGEEHLVDHRSGLKYIRSAGNHNLPESNVRSILNAGLVYFNNWMKDNLDINRKLADKVKISFTDYLEKPEGDTIYYSTGRPLTWVDFQSRIRPGARVEAQVMPGLGYNQAAKITKGTIHVSIAMKTYLPKSTCWVNGNSKDAYTLNHEQRHFDIVKIIAEQFKKKILKSKLTPDTFEAAINMQYLDSYRDMDAMQTAYDKETNHGTNTFAQSAWDRRIDDELKL